MCGPLKIYCEKPIRGKGIPLLKAGYTSLPILHVQRIYGLDILCAFGTEIRQHELTPVLRISILGVVDLRWNGLSSKVFFGVQQIHINNKEAGLPGNRNISPLIVTAIK